MEIKLGVVILNYNDAETTINLVSVLRKYKTISKIVVVDNSSTDDSFVKLSYISSSKVDVIKTERNGGYGYGNNYGISYLINVCNPTHVLIANPDVVVDEEVIKRMIEIFKIGNRIAVVAPFMLDRNGDKVSGTAWRLPTKYEYIFSAGLLIGHIIRPTYYPGLTNMTNDHIFVDCVAGSLLMVSLDAVSDCGLYDENIFLFGEETTIGCKLKQAGYRTVLLLQDSFLHYHGVSIKKSIKSEVSKRKLMLKSRVYILETYLGANIIDLLLARTVYSISMLEFRILIAFRSLKKRS